MKNKKTRDSFTHSFVQSCVFVVKLVIYLKNVSYCYSADLNQCNLILES